MKPLLADGLEHRISADFEHPRDVTDARTIQGHWDNQLSQFRSTALVGVVEDQLARAVLTLKPLLAISGCAILLNRQRAAPRTGDFIVFHSQRLT